MSSWRASRPNTRVPRKSCASRKVAFTTRADLRSTHAQPSTVRLHSGPCEQPRRDRTWLSPSAPSAPLPSHPSPVPRLEHGPERVDRRTAALQVLLATAPDRLQAERRLGRGALGLGPATREPRLRDVPQDDTETADAVVAQRVARERAAERPHLGAGGRGAAHEVVELQRDDLKKQMKRQKRCPAFRMHTPPRH